MCGISVVVALGQNKILQQNEVPKFAEMSTVSIMSNGTFSNGVPTYGFSDNDIKGTVNKISPGSRLLTNGAINQSLDNIAHRGPDSRGHWLSRDGRVLFGHVRLSINDLSPSGAQPFHDIQGYIHAVVNGELYDSDRIREQLLDNGYQFQGHSDCEIVVALYQQFGTSFLQHLRGEFALCLYDSQTNLFIASRDRYGIKPLFWTVFEGQLLVASEAKAFLPFGWRARWDVKALMDDGWRHDQRTPFEGLSKVRPGHYLTCNAFGSIETRQYWDLEFPNKTTVDPRSEQELIEGVRGRLLDAVRLRLRADVPVGVYLSGGVDSSAIAGIMQHLLKEEIGTEDSKEKLAHMTCFTIAFDQDSGMDESDIAERTAAYLGLPLVKMHMDEAEIAKRFEDAVWHSEHQNYDLNFVGKFALSEAPKKMGYKVVLTGEGADEVFAGYPSFLPDYLREPDHSLPGALLTDAVREKALHAAERTARDFYKHRALTPIDWSLSPARRQLNSIISPASLYGYTFPYFSPWTSDSYGSSDTQTIIANNADVRVQQLIQQTWHPLNSALYIWAKGNLANVLLSCLGDRAEMGHSIEGRLPFLDHELTEYVNGVPPSLKLRYDKQSGSFTEKWLLREAVKPFIPHEVYTRKKHGYAAPAQWPRDGPLHKLFKNLITYENIEALGFFDWNSVNGLLEAAFEKGDTRALRCANVLAQWVVLGKRFSVEKATPYHDDVIGIQSSPP
ncbi:asparagine synthase [Pyrenochaeta sp. MPI-SDFR-AT-0127]|nr:asparagine synthase [Pyrenochaeta sp. MPI-SDFR-AT-0127]